MKTTNNNTATATATTATATATTATATATTATATTAPVHVDIVKGAKAKPAPVNATGAKGKGIRVTDKPATATTKARAKVTKEEEKAKAKALKDAKREEEKKERERIATGKAEITAKTRTLSQALKGWNDILDMTLSCGVSVRDFLSGLGVNFEGGNITPATFIATLRALCPACVDKDNTPLRFIARTCTEMCEDKDITPRTIHTYYKPAKAGGVSSFKPLKVWDIEKVTEFDSNVLFALLDIAPRFADMKKKKEESNKSLCDALTEGQGDYYVRTGNKATCTAKTQSAVTTFAKVTPACVNVPAHI